MKMKFAFAMLLALMFLQLLLKSCSTKSVASGEEAVKAYFFKQTDSLLSKLTLLDSMAGQKQPVAELQALFAESRFTYKKTESITEYYFQGLTKRINGAPLPDIKTEDGQVWPPHGFQVIEQLLYSGYHDSLVNDLSNEIKLLQTDLRFTKANMQHNSVLPQHVTEILQHQLIRIAALGISGFDAAMSLLSLPETAHSLLGLKEVYIAYYGEVSLNEKLNTSIVSTINYLNKNDNFDNFNRLEFLSVYLMPLSELFVTSSNTNTEADTVMVKPFRGTLADLLRGKGLDADYYSSYAEGKTNAAKVELGKQLFFDKQLSSSGEISCASCHQPELYFTDGKTKAGNFVHGGTLQRNTPTLYYAAMQSHQFYDVRSTTLEDQADEVMKNKLEFNFTSAAIAKKIYSNNNYHDIFSKSFGEKDSASGYQLRNALAAFVRSLSPFSSRLDEYFNGNKNAITSREITGFNLFTGKAKCGTCHFIPLFNGNIPPWYSKSESEIIGVPSAPVWKNATIDKDSGRYKINAMQELLFAFKTPGIRNIEKTAPYMHNGVYKNLEDVVEFYHKGGGVGIGIDLPFQSLPFDSLSLNQSEKKSIIAFMKTLTDKKKSY